MNITQQMQEAEEQVKQQEAVKEQTVEAGTAPKFLTATFLNPERLTDETKEDYKLRQKANKLYLKYKKKGQMLWLSKDVSKLIKGTTFNKQKFIEAMKAFEESQTKRASEAVYTPEIETHNTI